MRMRLLAAVAAAALLLPLTTASAFAEASPPANDSVAAAQDVEGPLPWSWQEDTTNATTEPVDERVLQEGCALSIGLNGTVWFRYTDTEGAGFAVDVSDSDFIASVAVVEGDPETGHVVACAEGRVANQGAPGQTFWIMAYSDRPSVNGGHLDISVEPLRPAPTAALTVDASPTAYADGTVRVSGTYTCEYADAQLAGKVSQGPESHERANHFFIAGLSCDGAAHPWEALASSFSGQPVTGGRATATASFFACGDLQCAVSDVEQTVQVRRAVSR
jgi:hypothetical protein